MNALSATPRHHRHRHEPTLQSTHRIRLAVIAHECAPRAAELLAAAPGLVGLHVGVPSVGHVRFAFRHC
jgi:hypothetical protein